MLGQVSCKQHSRLNTMLLHEAHHLTAVNAVLTGKQKTKPAGLGIDARFRQNQLVRDMRVCIRRKKLFLHPFKIMTPALYKGGKFL